MPPIDEDSSPLSRLYEAPCPKVGAPLTQPIPLTLGTFLGVCTLSEVLIQRVKIFERIENSTLLAKFIIF